MMTQVERAVCCGADSIVWRWQRLRGYDLGGGATPRRMIVEEARMRVMQIASARVPGGLLGHVCTLSRGLLAANHDVGVILAPDAGLDDAASELAALGAVVHRLRVRGKSDLTGLRQLRRRIAAARPDVVHVHLSSPVEAVPVLLAARRAGDHRLITTEHSPTFAPLRRFYSAAVKRNVSRRLDAIITVCAADANALVRDFGLDRLTITVIPNGIDGFSTLPARAQARRQLGIPDDSGYVIGYAGTLSTTKGIADLLEASGRSRIDPLIVVLAGSGPLEEELRDAARDHPYRLELPGFLPDIRTFLASLDLFVLPSHSEAMPLALLEAMWAGLPTVSTRVGGIPEVVEDGVSGLLVPPASPDALAAAIRRLWQERDMASRLGAAARVKAHEQFSARRMVREVEALYERLLAGATP